MSWRWFFLQLTSHRANVSPSIPSLLYSSLHVRGCDWETKPATQLAPTPAPAVAFKAAAAPTVAPAIDAAKAPAVAITEPIRRNALNEISAGYNAAGLPVYIGPRGGIYHYDKEGGKVYYRNKSEIRAELAAGITVSN